MKKSLQVKMVLIMTLLAVSLMLVVGTMLVNNVTSFYNNDFLRQVETFFDEETLKLLNQAGQGGAQALYERIEVYSSQLGIDTYRNFYLFDRQGNYLTGPNEELGRALQMRPNLLKARGGERGNEQGIAERYMDYAVALDDYVIYIKDSKDEVDALKEARKGEEINLIKARQEELNAKFYEISEKFYKAAAEQAQAQQGADGAQPGNDAGYTEANYTDVPEDND